jgi:hypothetical protein
VSSSCLKVSGDLEVSELAFGCATAAVTGTRQVSGLWITNPDGSYIDATTTTGVDEITVGPACRLISGTRVTCPSLASTLQRFGYKTVTCADANGGCLCSAAVEQRGGLALLAAAPSTGGRLTTANNTISTDDGRQYPYCTSNERLTLGLKTERPNVTGTIEFRRAPSSGLVIDKSAADFGTVGLGASSSAVELTVTNMSTATTGAISVVYTGPFTGTGCGLALVPGASCTERVVFTPTAAGQAVGTVRVSSSRGETSASLTGFGVKAALTMSPSVADLGSVDIGQRRAGQVVVSNTGVGPADRLAVSVTGTDFAIDGEATTCKSSLAAGATCAIGYTFAPKTKGDRSAQIAVVATGAAAVAVVTASVPGPAALVVSPTTASFTSKIGQESAALPLIIVNSGESTTGTLSAAIGGPGADSFRMTASTCTQLTARAYCTIRVIFKAETTGAKTAILTVADSSVTTTVALTGTATP